VFFLIVLLFSFCSFRFLHCILHICMYTRPFHRRLYREISFPFRFHTSRALGALAFRCLSLCARRRNPHNLPPSPRSFLEPISQPSRTLTPATALVCFVLGTASGVPAHHFGAHREGSKVKDLYATSIIPSSTLFLHFSSFYSIHFVIIILHSPSHLCLHFHLHSH
jgi:hypothetical protein